MADLLESKRDVPAEAARRREAIHLYGVDLLNTKEVGTAVVEWALRYLSLVA